VFLLLCTSALSGHDALDRGYGESAAIFLEIASPRLTTLSLLGASSPDIRFTASVLVLLIAALVAFPPPVLRAVERPSLLLVPRLGLSDIARGDGVQNAASW